jgi:hypothetical protein
VVEPQEQIQLEEEVPEEDLLDETTLCDPWSNPRLQLELVG